AGPRSPPDMTALLWFCFALSGAGALALELLWMRSAGLVLGTTAETAATVVAGYFAGLGLGGWLARHAPRAPVRRYGRLELVGARTSSLAAASASALAGRVALWVGDAPQPPPAPAATPRARPSRLLWLTAAGTGLVGIGLEILWTAFFAQVLHNSVYSFAAVS